MWASHPPKGAKVRRHDATLTAQTYLPEEDEDRPITSELPPEVISPTQQAFLDRATAPDDDDDEEDYGPRCAPLP